MADEQSYGEVIRRWRDANGVSQEDLAAKVGVSQRNPNRWETGRTLPRQGVWDKLLALGIDIGPRPRVPKIPDQIERRLTTLERVVARLVEPAAQPEGADAAPPDPDEVRAFLEEWLEAEAPRKQGRRQQ